MKTKNISEKLHELWQYKNVAKHIYKCSAITLSPLTSILETFFKEVYFFHFMKTLIRTGVSDLTLCDTKITKYYNV